MGPLAVVFVAIPLLEIAMFVVVGGRIGALNTIGLVVLTGIVGAVVAVRQGTAVLARAQAELAQGRFPGAELAHGAMVLVGGVLLITPGFLTDGVGFLLMAPPVRETIRKWGKRRFGARTGVIEI